MIIHSYVFAILFPSLADSKRAFLALPVGNPSGGCQLQPHGNLTPALSPGHSRVSIIIPPACHRHRRVLSPNGRILILRLADLSATEVLYRINWYSIVKDQSCATGSPKGIAGYATLQRLSDMVKTAF